MSTYFFLLKYKKDISIFRMKKSALSVAMLNALTVEWLANSVDPVKIDALFVQTCMYLSEYVE